MTQPTNIQVMAVGTWAEAEVTRAETIEEKEEQP